jgi:hypothetical protein|tara:strand:- start:201 stop:473 length:273 start_codon:yes stop_codon:yes gene_type:complete
MTNLNEVVVGTKLIGNWCSSMPFSYGIVTGIIKSVSGVSVPPVAVVKWEDMGEIKYPMSDLNSVLNDGMSEVNGTGIGLSKFGIGIYFEE